ncbi:hypothetical protein FRC12_019103 [Ceratobasidium sp. 428]|nr:hypothetical protein FRC09_001009 [Ceratobasidium sp. 395]KAG8783994.1 hypothetical protein FRC12_019103 [Ceratobasidium sp. 428]
MTRAQDWKNKFPGVEFDILELDDPKGVPNSYIIQLKESADSKAHMDWLRSKAASMGPGDIEPGYEFDIIKGYACELSDDGISAIAASPDVESINQNKVKKLKKPGQPKA